jgi:multiple sugar transport system permease protein
MAQISESIPAADVQARKVGGAKVSPYLRGFVLHGLIMLGGVVMVFPFVWMFLSAFKVPGQIIRYPPVWIPNPWTLDSFEKAWETIALGRLFINSLFQASVVTTIVLITSSLTGYVLAKFRFPGRELLFIALLSTMMIPWPVFLLPQYIVVVWLQLINTYWALLLPGLYSSFGIFLFRQFMHSIPNDLLDAARIDGAGEHRIFWRIVLPLCGPPLAALGIFTFMWNWDSLLWPLIVLNDDNLYTLPIGLALASNLYWTDYGLVMAGSTISVIPVVIVYLLFQRWFVEGIALTGIKG